MDLNQYPTLLVKPESVGSKGPAVLKLAQTIGLTPDPWQANLVNEFLAIDANGDWAADLCGMVISRQQGKSELVILLILAGILLFDEKSITYSAHSAKTVKQIFRRIKEYCNEVPALKKRLSKVISADGREFIEFSDGKHIEFFTRKGSNPRGFSSARIILDEAQELADSALEAIIYAASAIPNHQLMLLGTVPEPSAMSQVIERHHRLAVENSLPRAVWAEWSYLSIEGVDLDDPEAQKRVNPAYSIRLTPETIARERSSSSDSGFSRERMSVWSTGGVPQVIPPEMWTAQERDISDPLAEIVSDRAIAIDTSLDRSKTSVAVAGMNDNGDYVIALLEQFDHPESAVNFVANFVAANDIRAVVVDAQSQAGTLVDLLKRRKVRATVTSERDMAAACGSIYDGAIDGWLYHIGQYQLTQSLGQARKRPLLNGAAWAWNRKTEDSDICPLIAVTLALYGSMHSRVKAPGRGETPDFVDLPRRSKPQGMVILN